MSLETLHRLCELERTQKFQPYVLAIIKYHMQDTLYQITAPNSLIMIETISGITKKISQSIGPETHVYACLRCSSSKFWPEKQFIKYLFFLIKIWWERPQT